MTCGELFAGIGGIGLGLERAGMTVRWQVEKDAYCRRVLAKHWPDVARYGDVKDVGAHNLEPVDVICGGFPCQPVSVAGKRKAQDDERWLWPEFARIICELRPDHVLVENVPGLLSQRGWIDEPNDRCVCGWPYRRRGMYHDRKKQKLLRSAHRCGDDETGIASPTPTSGEVRRQDPAHSGRHGAMGSSVGVGVVRTVGGRITAGDYAVLGGEARPSESGPVISVGDGQATPSPEWLSDVDATSTDSLHADPFGNAGIESEGAIGRGGWRRLVCPSCGRNLGDSPTRSIQRSAMGDVLGDLAELGYDAQWGCVSAASVGAPHLRRRIFIVAKSTDAIRRAEHGGVDGSEKENDRSPQERRIRSRSRTDGQASGMRRRPADTGGALPHPESFRIDDGRGVEYPESGGRAGDAGVWSVEPDVGRVADGVPARVDRLRALGNAVVPQVAEYVGRRIMRAAA